MRAVVVLPTYNERDNIEPYLRALRAVSTEIDVLVVDDNSPDGTAERARQLGAELGGVDVLQRSAKEGLGSAYRAGFRQALDGVPPYDVIVSMDADLSHDPAVIPAIEPDSTGAEGYAFLTELIRRLTRHEFTIVETPIVFRDRERGKSKMSGRIIIESMLLVTRWATIDLIRRMRSTAP